MNWTALKIALEDIPIWQLRALTCILAGSGLLVIARLAGHRIALAGPIFRPIVVGALFNVTGWNVLSAYGVSLISSSEAVMIAYTMPVWATLLGVIILGERLGPRTVMALVLGTAGVVLLVLEGGLGELGRAPWGAIATLAAAMVWAGGIVFQKRNAWPLPVIVMAGWQLLIGAVPIAIAAFLLEPLAIQAARPASLLAFAYVAFVGMIFGYYAWFQIVKRYSASFAAISTVAVPVMGTFSGALLLGEPLGWRQLLALCCVVGALSLIMTADHK